MIIDIIGYEEPECFSCCYVFRLLALMLFINSQDIVSEHPERFFVGEIVREKIFMQYRNEIPYACQVIWEILSFICDIATLLPQPSDPNKKIGVYNSKKWKEKKPWFYPFFIIFFWKIMYN